MTKTTKVLMFGWEFPPHISGGLGTACYGLSTSLIKGGTEVIFVVPRAHGDETIRVVNASDVMLSECDKAGDEYQVLVRARVKNVRIIAVPSPLSPYTSTFNEPANALEEWNYEIPSSKAHVGSVSGVVKGKQYRLSGTYGPHLLREVELYGEVASAIATEHDFDVIHAHDWLAYPAGVAAKNVSGKPLIVHVHATEYDRTGKGDADPRVLAIEKEGMMKADLIVAVSEWTKQIITDKYGISEAKVEVVHNGVSPKDNYSRHKAFPAGKHVVTFLGRVTYQKGPQYFVEAARKVLDKFPETHFVIVGSGDLLTGMIDRVAELKFSSRFHFTGFLRGNDVDQVWSVTDLYVMPSVSEPFGIAPLEAIQAGVPVIISKQSGVSEVMAHAIKVDFWDTEALANAICNVLQHKSLTQTLKKKSREALREITWDKAARKITQLYHALK